MPNCYYGHMEKKNNSPLWISTLECIGSFVVLLAHLLCVYVRIFVFAVTNVSPDTDITKIVCIPNSWSIKNTFGVSWKTLVILPAHILSEYPIYWHRISQDTDITKIGLNIESLMDKKSALGAFVLLAHVLCEYAKRVKSLNLVETYYLGC